MANLILDQIRLLILNSLSAAFVLFIGIMLVIALLSILNSQKG